MNRVSVIARLKLFEGSTDYMYKCTGGEVTVGIGHALPSVNDAAQFAWHLLSWAPYVVASVDQVRLDYGAVQAAPLGQVATAYSHLTQCRMGADDVEKLAATDVQSFESQLVTALPKWPSYPDSAQQALFDMAFNLGLGGLKKFHRMLRAADFGDWVAAAAACHRLGIGEERNRATAELFLRAANHGA